MIPSSSGGSSGGSTSIADAAKRAVTGGMNAVVGGSAGVGTAGTTAALVLKKHLYGHYEPITCLAASEAHSIAVSGSKDRTCIMWNLEKLCFLRQLRRHAGTVAAVCINDLTGDVAVAAGASVYLWDINGRLLACASIFSSSFNLPMPSPLTTHQEPSSQQGSVVVGHEQILSICFSQAVEWDCANVIVTGSSDGVVRFWSETMLPTNDETAVPNMMLQPEAVQQPSATLLSVNSLSTQAALTSKNKNVCADPVAARLPTARTSDGRDVVVSSNAVSAANLLSPSGLLAIPSSRPRRCRHISLSSEDEIGRSTYGSGARSRCFTVASEVPNLVSRCNYGDTKQLSWSLANVSVLSDLVQEGDGEEVIPNDNGGAYCGYTKTNDVSAASAGAVRRGVAPPLRRYYAVDDSGVPTTASGKSHGKAVTPLSADDQEFAVGAQDRISSNQQEADIKSLASLDASSSDEKNVQLLLTTPQKSTVPKWKRQLVLRAQYDVQEIVYGRNRRFFAGVRNNINSDGPLLPDAGGRISVTAVSVSKDSRVLYVGDSHGRVTGKRSFVDVFQNTIPESAF